MPRDVEIIEGDEWDPVADDSLKVTYDRRNRKWIKQIGGLGSSSWGRAEEVKPATSEFGKWSYHAILRAYKLEDAKDLYPQEKILRSSPEELEEGSRIFHATKQTSK